MGARIASAGDSGAFEGFLGFCQVGLGRIVVSEIEAPNILVNLV